MPNQTEQPQAEKLLTKQQLAERLSVTTRSVDRWLLDGVLPADCKVQIGDRVVRFRQSAIDAWVTAGCPGAQ